MLKLFQNLIGLGSKVVFTELMDKDATIVDVRRRDEFAGGHIKGSINIPLQELASKMNTIDKNKPVITCCLSGVRSAAAKSSLKSNGFEVVHNGGGWKSLKMKLANGK